MPILFLGPKFYSGDYIFWNTERLEVKISNGSVLEWSVIAIDMAPVGLGACRGCTPMKDFSGFFYSPVKFF